MASFTVTGKLVHADERQDPLHAVYIELHDGDVFRDDFLGSGYTKADGTFAVYYDPSQSGMFDRPDLRLRIYRHEHSFDQKSGDVVLKKVLVAEIEGPQNASFETFHFGTLRVDWFEYDRSMGLPRCKVLPNGDLPQKYADGYWPALILRDGPLKIRHLEVKTAINVGAGVDVPWVQARWPRCLTQQVDAANPGTSRSDNWFGRRVLDGFNPALPERLDDGRYRVAYEFDDLESDGYHDLASVTADFELTDSVLLPVRIVVSLREPGQTAPFSKTTVREHFRGDPDWEPAKRIFRTAWNIAGELDAHLCAAHLNVEQYAIAGYRNLRRNPVAWLLFPHLRDVVLINRVGDEAIFGVRGIMATSSPLTSGSVRTRLGQGLGRLDWRGWSPRRPLSDDHRYARAQQRFWEVVTGWVDEFFERYGATIAGEWLEVRRFSDDFVRNSVERIENDDRVWYDPSERLGDRTTPYVPFGQAERAVRPLTVTDTPQGDEIDQLKQLCRYLLVHATFVHSWANDRQSEDGGEVVYGSLSLRNGSYGAEGDLRIAPAPNDANDQLFFGHALATPTRGRILRNEDDDIGAGFVGRLRAAAADFEALGLDVDQIRSRINI